MALSPDQRRRLLRMNMLMSYAAFASAKATTAWTPATLFANAEVGGWYDPSDLTTLFQDAAGTTPVTAVEQPVGLVLDKSKSLPFTEIVTNGSFDSSTGWTLGSGWAIGSGVLTGTNISVAGATASFPATIIAGRSYRTTFTLSSISGNGVSLQVGGVNGTSRTAAGTYTEVIVASTTSAPSFAARIGTTTVTIDNVSVVLIPENSLSQSTSTARPVLSARVNLLTYSEQFDNAAWVKNAILAFGSGSVANAIAAPTGTTTADFVVPTATTAEHYLDSPSVTFTSGVAYTFSAYAKTGGYSWFRLAFSNSAFAAAGRAAWFNISNGTLGTVQSGVTASITDVGDGWYRCSITATANATGTFANFLLIVNADNTTSFAANGTSGIYLWGADLRPANAGVGLPAYQRVGAATAGSSTAAGNADYDSGPEWPRYLRFDGVDDFLQSSTITPGADKAQVFAGVRKLSDSPAYALIAETSTASFSTDGAWGLFASNGTATQSGYAVGVRANAQYDKRTGAFPAPHTAVLAMTSFLGGTTSEQSALRVNGVDQSLTVITGTNAGTGNYTAQPLYVGSRAGSALRFNGHIYSLIIVGRALTAAEIASTETWVNNRTKAY